MRRDGDLDAERAGEARCLTCADAAVPARVVALTGDGMATVETGATTAEISVELVTAAVGDTVLVHAGVAIGTVR